MCGAEHAAEILKLRRVPAATHAGIERAEVDRERDQSQDRRKHQVGARGERRLLLRSDRTGFERARHAAALPTSPSPGRPPADVQPMVTARRQIGLLQLELAADLPAINADRALVELLIRLPA